jgi:hypothetical protein
MLSGDAAKTALESKHPVSDGNISHPAQFSAYAVGGMELVQ